MKCPYCGTKFDIATLDEHQKKIKSAVTGDFDWSATDESVIWEGADFDDLSSAACPSCGAEFFGNKNTAATVCPCCGNAQIITKHLSGGLKPDYVIPFRLEKKAAVAAMKEFCEGKRLLPDCFVQNNHIENTQGIYAPFWLFDAEAYGNLCFKTIKITSPKGGNEHHGSALRNGVLTFEKVPVDASEKMNDAFMDAIEPFDYADLKDFHKSFLAGYMAEKYDVSMEKCKTRAELRIEATLENEFKKSVKGYKSVTLENSHIKVKKGKISYGLFPVWVLNTKYNNENYQFIMNGQTGRLAGWLPTDRGKAFKYTAAIAGVTGALLTALLFILTTTGTFSMSLPPMILMAWCAAVAAGISVVHILESKMNTAREKTQACDYIVRGSLKFKVTKDDL
jgi:predicted RNA-binding Zn-ribbon protein involved in translation (DUF1610 family)